MNTEEEYEREQGKLEQARLDLNDAQTKLERCELVYKQVQSAYKRRVDLCDEAYKRIQAQEELKLQEEKLASEREQFEFELEQVHSAYKRRLLKCDTAEEVARARAAFNDIKAHINSTEFTHNH